MTDISRQKHMPAKGQVITTSIVSLAAGGEGVAKEQGVPIFIERVAPEDVVDVEVYDVRKDFAKGQILRIVKYSKQRTEPPCKLFKVCGGCQWQHIAYEWQLKAKEDIVKQAITRIGGLDASLVLPCVPAEEPLFYRNKVQFPVAHPQGSQRLLAGYYQQGSHKIVNIKHCPVQPEPLDRMLKAVKEVLEQEGFSAYDEKTRRGLLRHINARYSFAQNTVLVILVINAKEEWLTSDVSEDFKRLKKKDSGTRLFSLAELESAAQKIMDKVPEIVGVSLNYNTHPGNRILGEKTVCLKGEDHLIEVLASHRPDMPDLIEQGIKFRLSPTSFFQVNSRQAVRLLEAVIELVGDLRNALVVDAFAGVGTMALWLACFARQVIAVEEHPTAVEDGRVNLQLNEIKNVEFYLGQVEDVFPKLRDIDVKPDLLLIDPPRKGGSTKALNEIVKLAPSRIVYVSCNPATLARDLKFLEGNGYKTKQIRPIDMFPQTYHVESVAVLDRQS